MKYRDRYIEGKDFTRIVKALSSDIRVQILEMLGEEDSTIQSITTRLKLSKTTVITHLNILEKAGFITMKYVRGSVGNQKICHKEYDRLIFNFTPVKENELKEHYYEVNIDIGNFFDFSVYPPCGLSSVDHIIQKWDDPSAFFHPDRVEAALLWCAYGFVEYRIPLNIPFEETGFSRIEILIEMSAQGEVPTHKALMLPADISPKQLTDGVSDMVFSVNGAMVARHTIHEYGRKIGGNYSKEKGIYTPIWWKGSSYGELLHIVIDKNGSSVNGERSSSVNVDEIFPRSLIERSIEMNKGMRSTDSMKLRIGIPPDADHVSGFNIYGAGFGNYDHGIIVRFFPQKGQ